MSNYNILRAIELSKRALGIAFSKKDRSNSLQLSDDAREYFQSISKEIEKGKILRAYKF